MTAPLARLALVALLGLASLAPTNALAQFDALKKAAGKVAENTPNLSRITQGEPAISTSLEDAVWGVDSLDGYNPGEAEFRTIADLARSEHGGFLLEPGLWQMHTQSYCLHAGTHGPGGGDGYLYAPPRGMSEAAIIAIVRNSINHPEVPQRDIQVLLWAIISRAKFEDMSAEMKLTVARLLDEEMLLQLNRTALDLVPDVVLQQALQELPPFVRQVVEAEARLRRMLTEGYGSYDELERVAVLAGMAPEGPGSRAVPSGRWSLHPDGYYVRYLPNGYSYTVTQIWVPQGSPAVGKEYDPSMHIAVPGNTARQRLLQSGRFYETT